MNQEENKFIDTHKLIKTKNPKLYKYLPNFIINLFRNLIHEDFINKIITTGGEKRGPDFAQHVMSYFNANIIAEGLDDLPKDGHFLFAANHPLGGLESVAMMTIIAKKYKNIRFVVNDLLLGLKKFEPIFVGVNKHGKTRRDAFQKLNEAYQSENQILYFPAGLVSRKNNGIIRDLEWKKSFVSIATQSNRSIVPVYIDAVNSNFFYSLANLRKKLGIKANIEMLFLPNEMYKQKGKTLTIKFGKPISTEEIKESKLNFSQWAEKIKSQVYDLAKDNQFETN